ncbi:MFS transporter [Micromonospora sp. KLBMP9576]|uniref:MFS transporter n=1 Tax=Micromonospora sp. KLBMP9576 TaxID=3424769 RepID=UPI003D8DD0EB
MRDDGGRQSSPLMAAGAGALQLVALFGSFAATPLFPLYSAAWDLEPAHVSVAFAGYPVGVLIVMTLLGGLSDLIGRKWMLLLGAALVLTAFVVTAAAWSLPALVAGRIVQGMATGLIASTSAAALLEFHPRGPRAGSLAHAVCTTVGMGLGPLLSGVLAEGTDRPLVVPYAVLAALALAPLALVLPAPGDRRVTGGARMVRAVRVPRGIWLPFSVAALSLMMFNGCMALFGTFGSRILAEGAGRASTGGTGGLLSLLLGSTLLAQLALHRLPAARSACLGVLGTAAGTATTALALHVASAPATFAGTALIGFGGGLTLLGANRLIGEYAPAHRRAETYAAWMVCAFVALGGASVATGLALGDTSLTLVLTGASGIIALCAVYALLVTRFGLHRR